MREYKRFQEKKRDIRDLFEMKRFHDDFLRFMKKFRKTYCISPRYLLQYVVQLVFMMGMEKIQAMSSLHRLSILYYTKGIYVE